MAWKWQGPIRLDEFLQPRRGAFRELRYKGVYVLQVTEPVDERRYEPVVLRRLLREDPTGTLYVGGVPRGANSTVFHRLKDLARTVEYAHTGNRVSHSGGWNAYV